MEYSEVKNLMKVKVELLGLCGAGKTTFLKGLTSKLDPDIDLGLAYSVIPSLSQRAISLMRILLTGFSIKPVSFSSFLMKRNNWWLIKKIAFRSAGIKLRADSNFILVDSGILQPFLSFEIEENTIDVNVPIHNLLSGCKLPDLLIVFNISPRIAMNRYEQRGLQGDGKLIRDNSDNYFNKAEELRKNLISYCKDKNVHIIEVDSSENFSEDYLDSKLTEIYKFLKKE